jgi:hypothetical protein
VVDSGWYDKVDRQRYLFSWLIWSVGKRINPWLRVGQHVTTGALSTIYAAISPELQGLGSTMGQLHYFGPSYILVNWFNTSRRWVWNPWVHVTSATKRMYEETQNILADVDKQIEGVAAGLGSNGLGAAPLGVTQ